MIEKPKRPKRIPNQDNKQPQTIHELIRRYDLDNTKIYDFLEELVETLNKCNIAKSKINNSNQNIDANTTMEPLILTSINTPVSDSLYYIQTIIYKTNSTSNTRRSQVAIGYLTTDIYQRYYKDGNWSEWIPAVMDLVRSSYNIDNIKITTFCYTSDITRTPNGANGYLFTQRMHNDYILQEFTAYDGNAKWIRTKKEGVWSKWECIYSKPERATIELANSWSAHAAQTPQIYRNANMLHISFIVREGTDTLIAMLPEGFRPKNTIFVPATNLFKNSGTLINIQSDGKIVCESADVGGLLTLNATLLAQ